MAEAAAPEKPPLAGMMRFINVVPGLILRSPLHGLMSRKTLMFGFTGRRSGRRYTIPMSYVRVGDEVFMSTEAPWWKNLAAGAPVELLLRGENVSGFAEAVPDEEGSAEVLDAILRRYPEYGRFVGVTLDEDGRPDGEKVRDAARRGRVGIRVRLREEYGA